MSWGEVALWWLPTASVAAMTALGLVAIAMQPSRPARKYWIAAVLLGGALAIGASAWKQQAGRAALVGETARLQELGTRLVALNARIKDLEDQARALQEKARSRQIDPDTAAKMAEYLRQSGSHRVVVSCVPDDVEAYGYANQIANVLRAAGWEAPGLETTTIFGDAPAMGVTLYVRGGATPPEAARLLLDAFARFNIPYQSGITPSTASPDPATTELFVSHKP